MRNLSLVLLAVAGLLGATACDGGGTGCDESSDCPEIMCDDGTTIQACLFNACIDSCESSSGMDLTEADAGR